MKLASNCMVIRNGTLVDGTGRTPVADGVVVLREGKIAYAGPAKGAPEMPPNAEVIDAQGGTILPGLVEAHWHPTYFNVAALEDLDIKYPVEYVTLLAAANARLALECGYTAARSGGSLFNIDVWLKKAIEEDVTPGPRLAASGREICGAAGLMDWNPDFRKIGMEGLVLLINGADEARAAVRRLVKDGVEWVKTYPTGDAAAPDTNDHHTLCMTFEEMHAVVATAHNHGLKVTGHCRATEGIKNALRAGYDAIEHGTFMDDEALELLLQRNTPVVPALYFELASIERGPDFGMPQAVVDGHKETLEGGAESARKILKAGGRLGMGGDYGFAWNPHGEYAKELEFFVKYVGFSPLETITCATKTGAEILGRGHEIGTLEPGKLGDVLVVAGDVLKDMGILQDRSKILSVIQGGIMKAGRLAHSLTSFVTLLLCALLVCSSAMSRIAVAASESEETEAATALARDAGKFELRVVGPNGKPVPQAHLEIRTKPAPTAEQFLRGKFVKLFDHGTIATTDKEGRMTIDLPEISKDFAVNIITPGYAPYRAEWPFFKPEEPVPAEFTAELEAAWSVGGIVADEAGNPVENAAVRPNIKFKMRPGDPNDMYVESNVLTDGEGKWRIDSVPESMKEVSVEFDRQDFQPARREYTRGETGIELDERPATVIGLNRGLTVTGAVTDEDGQPIAGALVRTKFGKALRQATTDAEGFYVLRGCEPRTAKIVVSAKGRAIDMQEAVIKENMLPIDFEMKPGGRIRIEVLDHTEHPVPKARIYFQRWRGETYWHSFALDQVNQFADENGIWEWDEAPLDELQVGIYGGDSMNLTAQSLIQREEPYVFRLPPPLVVSGRVFDAETGEPIPEFRVLPGVRYGPTTVSWLRHEALAGRNGEFRLRKTRNYVAWLVRIEAQGYLRAVSRDIESDEGQVALDFDMTKGKEIRGTVLTPAGEPATKAEIALALNGSQIRLRNGELADTPFAKEATDDHGEFRLVPTEKEFQLMIVHPAGYAHVKATSDTMPVQITLTAWARVEGVYRVGREAVPSAWIMVRTFSLRSNDNRGPVIGAAYEAATGPDGRFRFERMMAGETRIGRRMYYRSDGDEDVSCSCMMPVEFEAGELTHLELGGTGRPVVGALKRPEGFRGQADWRYAIVQVRPDIEKPPMPERPRMPPEVRDNRAKAAVWMQQWRLTEAGKAWTAWEAASQEFRKRFESSPLWTARVDADGVFRVDDLPAGRYRMDVHFTRYRDGEELRLWDFKFTVPEMENGRSDEPLDLDVLTLTKSP